MNEHLRRLRGGEAFVFQMREGRSRALAFGNLREAYVFLAHGADADIQARRWKEHFAELLHGGEDASKGAFMLEAREGESWQDFAERIGDSREARLLGVTCRDVLAVLPNGISVTGW